MLALCQTRPVFLLKFEHPRLVATNIRNRQSMKGTAAPSLRQTFLRSSTLRESAQPGVQCTLNIVWHEVMLRSEVFRRRPSDRPALPLLMASTRKTTASLSVIQTDHLALLPASHTGNASLIQIHSRSCRVRLCQSFRSSGTAASLSLFICTSATST